MSRNTIKEFSKKARELYEITYDPASSIYGDLHSFRPFYSLVGFHDWGIYQWIVKTIKNESREAILQWMVDNARPLVGICLFNKFSWLDVKAPKGSLKIVDENNEETKAFVAVLLDNIRTESQERYSTLVSPKSQERHKDWLSLYIRDQSGIKKFFEQN